MSVVVRTRVAAKGNGAVVLPFDVVGATITVIGGLFKINGVQRTLVGDWTYTLSPQSEVQHVVGYIVRDTTTEDIELFVDDYLNSEESVDWSLAGKEPLYGLFTAAKVPANDVDFSNTTIEVFKTVETEAA